VRRALAKAGRACHPLKRDYFFLGFESATG
jgi:hypothetical protein